MGDFKIKRRTLREKKEKELEYRKEPVKKDKKDSL